MLKIESRKRIIATDQSTRDQLSRSFYGYLCGKELCLHPEELLYLMDSRSAECTYKSKQVTFKEVAAMFLSKKKFFTRYITYKDWRDRGLIILNSSASYNVPKENIAPRKYPSKKISFPKYKIEAIFSKQDLTSIANNDDHTKALYESLWFGQYGTYKASEKGKATKYDIYETIYLMEKELLKVENETVSSLVAKALPKHKDFAGLYEVYKDWREHGYVIKTGFKFGTHFRLYFPGAQPIKNENWIHSKHVVHVFPKSSKLLISEWARAIRVAHSVRKTFILAIPGKVKEKPTGIDFILFHRRGNDALNPEVDSPKYAMLSLSEEEYIGGKELAGAIAEAESKNLELLLSISDRETAVTYYKIKQIELAHSTCEYYEIDWIQP
ncbi:MAG: tRNA-intron lyase [Candidatus Micrarchaeia archaeon]